MAAAEEAVLVDEEVDVAREVEVERVLLLALDALDRLVAVAEALLEAEDIDFTVFEDSTTN